VHLHHGTRRNADVPVVQQLLAVEARLVLTHNVFASPWVTEVAPNAPVIEGVLGHWARRQLVQQRPSLSTRAAVLPNPQDLAFFRPPSTAERNEARAQYGLSADHRAILRTGSPIEVKWSTAYEQLAQRLQPRDRLLLVGAPPALASALSAGLDPRVQLLERTGNDEQLRRLYWAADVFAHDARRGESFGNVILEALGTGLPVVYRARPLRDNTPAELTGLPGFTYCRSRRVWLDEVANAVPTTRDQSSRLEPAYGEQAVAQRLEQVLAVLRKPEVQGPQVVPAVRAVLESSLHEAPLVPVGERVACWISHNVLTRELKFLKLRMTS
jgi:glycosyltransferase involved in cell wall biosynthesis